MRQKNVSHVLISLLSVSHQTIEKTGGRTRARTWDPLIKSQLLYQLSYAPAQKRASNIKDIRREPRLGHSRPISKRFNKRIPTVSSGPSRGWALAYLGGLQTSGTHSWIVSIPARPAPLMGRIAPRGSEGNSAAYP